MGCASPHSLSLCRANLHVWPAMLGVWLPIVKELTPGGSRVHDGRISARFWSRSKLKQRSLASIHISIRRSPAFSGRVDRKVFI